MQGGAMGMTTALIYPPSSYATTDELVEVAKVGGEATAASTPSHIRGEGKEVVASVDEADRDWRASRTARWRSFTSKVAHQPGWGTLMREVGRSTVDAARARGVDVAADLYVYTAGGTGLEATIPSWAHEGGRGALLEAARRSGDPRAAEAGDPNRLTGLVEHHRGRRAAGTASSWSTPRNPANAKLREENADRRSRSEMGQGPGGRRVRSRRAGPEPRDGDLPHDERAGHRDGARAFRGRASAATPARRSVAERAGRDRACRTRARYGNFPRVIARYVRERQRAHAAGCHPQDDVVAGDAHAPERSRPDPRRHAGPTSSCSTTTGFRIARPTRSRRVYPDGIEWVLVNGEVAIDRGRHTGARTGRVIYGPGRTIPTSDADTRVAREEHRLDETGCA